MINIYYNDWHYYHLNFSFFIMNTTIIYIIEPSFIDKELYEYVIEPKFLLYYI